MNIKIYYFQFCQDSCVIRTPCKRIVANFREKSHASGMSPKHALSDSADASGAYAVPAFIAGLLTVACLFLLPLANDNTGEVFFDPYTLLGLAASVVIFLFLYRRWPQT